MIESSYVFWLGLALPVAGVIVFSLMAPTARHALATRVNELWFNEEGLDVAEDEDADDTVPRDQDPEVDKFLAENAKLFSAWTKT